MANVGEIVYQVSMDVKGLLTGEQQVNKAMDGLEKSSGKATEAMSKLNATASHMATALKMPTINALSRDLAQLSGKIGANSSAVDKASLANSKFTGVIGTVSGAIGAGYIGNVGSATESLVRHTRAAIFATAAEVENAEAVKKQASEYQAAAAQIVVAARAKKQSADAAVKAAEQDVENLKDFETSNSLRQKELELLRRKQVLAIKEAENTYKNIGSEKNLQALQRTKSALYTTENNIKKHLAATGREIDQIERKLTAAKVAQTKATQDVIAATALEQRAKTTAAAANETLAQAQVRATQASTAQALAMTGLRNVMALFGGPVGVLMLAVAGVYALYQSMNDSSSIEKYKQEIDDAAKRVEYLTRVQAEASAVKTKIQLDVDTRNLKEAEEKVKSLENAVATMSGLGGNSTAISKFGSELSLARSTVEELSESVRIGNERLGKFNERAELAGDTTAKSAKRNEIYDASVRGIIDSNELLNKTLELGSSAAAEMEMKLEALGSKLIDAGYSADEAEIAVSNLRNKLETGTDLSFELMLQSIGHEVEALKIEMAQGAEAAIKYRAELKATAMGITDDGQISKLVSAEQELAKLRNQRSEQNKKGRKSGSKKDTAADALKKQAEALERLNNGYREGSLEMAKYDAVKALGDKASSAQIAQTEQLAAEKFAIEQRSADQKAALDADALAKAKQTLDDDLAQLKRQLQDKLIEDEQYHKRRAEINAEYAMKVAEASANAVVTPAQEMKAKVDPVQALANEHARKIALIKEYENQKVITQMQSLQLMRVANEEFEQQRLEAQWEIWRNQNLGNEVLAASFDAFANNASSALAGVASGSMSATDAVKQLANSVANQLINVFVQMGVEWVKSAIMGSVTQKAAVASTTAVQTASIATTTAASTTAAATTTAAWTPAAIVASIGSFGGAAAIGIGAVLGALAMGVAGRRFQGGPVDAGSMYRVGEGGKPEIFRASDGKQYMIPGDNGRVIANKDMGGSGGGSQVIINIQNYTSANVDARARDTGNGVTIDMIVADISQGGSISQAIERSHQAPRRATE